MQQTLFATATYPPRPQLKLLPLRERPAYRASSAPFACTSLELLAAVIGGPQQIETANALLAKFGTLRRLYNAHPSEIEGIPGVGAQTAARLKAALALGLRMATDDAQERTIITSPADAANLVMDMGLLPEERLRVLLLSTRNHVIEITEVYKGSVNSSQVRIAEVFQAAIAQKASAIIAAHNHPSGDVTPSPDDVAVTRAIVQAGKMLDISCLDHIIVGANGKWCSLKERGLGGFS